MCACACVHACVRVGAVRLRVRVCSQDLKRPQGGLCSLEVLMHMASDDVLDAPLRIGRFGLLMGQVVQGVWSVCGLSVVCVYLQAPSPKPPSSKRQVLSTRCQAPRTKPHVPSVKRQAPKCQAPSTKRQAENASQAESLKLKKTRNVARHTQHIRPPGPGQVSIHQTIEQPVVW